MSVYISAELRRVVHKRAEGRCEYCLMPEFATFAAHEIDHIIAQKHGGQTTLENLALACILCNKLRLRALCRWQNVRNLIRLRQAA
ncbi:HNH endonuclease [Candidatus Vecturithrix granuli]|uniref:HNH endonuclease n=1 Tax=Vecturithrix granuli TaxID=1499967 RepID=A0A081C2L0_VECG1|nr:HNH endonuclease [Candidatus Vecturithrix granuli]